MTMTGAARSPTGSPRHARFVRVTHWVSAAAVTALLLSGIEVLISHPRFYWGEIGNINTPALFSIPIPSSRSSVPTGYGFTLPDQNGWSRYLHFQSAWVVLFTGLVYVIVGWRSGHFRRNLVPAAADRSWHALRASITQHLRFRTEAFADPSSYNALQRISYLAVIFIVVPLLVWTGLAMSAGFSASFPGEWISWAAGNPRVRCISSPRLRLWRSCSSTF